MKCGIRKWLSKCGLCQVHTKQPERVPMGKMPLARCPGQYISVDLIGPLIPSRYSGACYLLVCIDPYSGWAEAYPLMQKTNEAVWEQLCNVTDQGSKFKGADFTAWLRGMGIEHRWITPYHPESNGKMERLNRTLSSYWISTSTVTGHRPVMLFHVCPPRYPLTCLLDEDESCSFTNHLEMQAEVMH